MRAEQHALADLALLEQKAPALPQLRKFKLLPVRYADEILYALLDVCSREQVVSHRRTVAATAEATASQDLAESAAEEAAAEAAIEAKKNSKPCKQSTKNFNRNTKTCSRNNRS